MQLLDLISPEERMMEEALSPWTIVISLAAIALACILVYKFRPSRKKDVE